VLQTLLLLLLHSVGSLWVAQVHLNLVTATATYRTAQLMMVVRVPRHDEHSHAYCCPLAASTSAPTLLQGSGSNPLNPSTQCCLPHCSTDEAPCLLVVRVPGHNEHSHAKPPLEKVPRSQISHSELLSVLADPAGHSRWPAMTVQITCYV
jgi:hypothetical protein